MATNTTDETMLLLRESANAFTHAGNKHYVTPAILLAANASVSIVNNEVPVDDDCAGTSSIWVQRLVRFPVFP